MVTLSYFDVKKEITMRRFKLWTRCNIAARQLTGHYGFEDTYEDRTELCGDKKGKLAVLFACTRLSQYITGKEVTVESDHQALQKIFKKPLITAPKRLQRMLMILQRYKMTVKYI
jgi:hypothetical protein